MGYYTSHSLEISEKPELIAVFREHNDSAAYALNDNGDPAEPCKWYESTSDMQSFSANHPNILMVMEGEGEEAGDIWKEYHMDGKYQRVNAKVTFDPFDPTKMKS